MAMAIRGFGELKILAIHFEFGHSPILAIRWSGVHFTAPRNLFSQMILMTTMSTRKAGSLNESTYHM